MNDKDLKKSEEAMRKITQPLRDQEPGPAYFADYSSEVIERIRARQQAPAPIRGWFVRGLAVCAVLTVAVLAVVRGPLGGGEGLQLASKPSMDALAEEIATLKALGEWSEEEDLSVFNEIVAEDLDSEISYGPRRSATG